MNDRKPPRFPYVGALLCAACVGAAAWTWMRYSYMWEVPLGGHCGRSLADYFVRMEGPTGNVWTARVVKDAEGPGLVLYDSSATRFTGASIAGLVVGVMGVFVFTAAFRHWLNQRRAFLVETAEGDT